MIKEAIIELTNKKNLTYDTAKTVMDEIMSGEASPVQMSAYLTALVMKGDNRRNYRVGSRNERARNRT